MVKSVVTCVKESGMKIFKMARRQMLRIMYAPLTEHGNWTITNNLEWLEYVIRMDENRKIGYLTINLKLDER